MGKKHVFHKGADLALNPQHRTQVGTVVCICSPVLLQKGGEVVSKSPLDR